MISLGILAGSLARMDNVSQYLPEELTNMISFSGGAAEEASSPDVEPIQVENSPVRLPPQQPGCASRLIEQPGHREMLPNLILTASEVPANWKIAKSETSGISNEDWAAGNDDAANILKVLNEFGSIDQI